MSIPTVELITRYESAAIALRDGTASRKQVKALVGDLFEAKMMAHITALDLQVKWLEREAEKESAA